MAFHELGHIELEYGIFIPKKRFGQRARQLGLADTCWAYEEERAYRAATVSHISTRTAHGPGNDLHCLMLTNHAPV